MAEIYVKNKAGLTGQTVPGRRIPGHWPYPGPEELAETEPCVPGLIDVRFFLLGRSDSRGDKKPPTSKRRL